MAPLHAQNREVATRPKSWQSVGLLSLFFCAAPAVAEDLATNLALAGHTYDQVVTQQLGTPICSLHDATSDTVSHYYQSGAGTILTVVVNEARWAVDFSHVIVATVESSPRLPLTCIPPVQESAGRSAQYLATSHGQLRLGASPEEALAVLGPPDATRQQDSLLRLDYGLDRDVSHRDVWTLTFTDGRLTGWSIRTFPVFYEVAG